MCVVHILSLQYNSGTVVTHRSHIQALTDKHTRVIITSIRQTQHVISSSFLHNRDQKRSVEQADYNGDKQCSSMSLPFHNALQKVMKEKKCHLVSLELHFFFFHAQRRPPCSLLCHNKCRSFLSSLGRSSYVECCR